MGLLNDLFGSRAGRARGLSIKGQERLRLWEKHLKDFKKREELSKFFSIANIGYALEHPEELDRVLDQIENLISKDIVVIDAEEKLENEILRDLARLAGRDSQAETSMLNSAIMDETQKQDKLKKLFKKILDVLTLELHLIRKIRQRSSNMRAFLSGLFRLIFIEEAKLYELFLGERILSDDRDMFGAIQKISRAIILEEKFDEDAVSAETEFINSMIDQMGPESRHSFRKLGERIFHELINLAKGRMGENYDPENLIEVMESILENDAVMLQIITKKKGRLQLSVEQIRWTLNAFKKAYTAEHFSDIRLH